MEKTIIVLHPKKMPLWQRKIIESLVASGFEVKLESREECIKAEGVSVFFRWAESEKKIQKILGDLLVESEISTKPEAEKEPEALCKIWLDYSPPPSEFEGIYVIHDIFYGEKGYTPGLFSKTPNIKTTLFYQKKNGTTILLKEAKSYAGNLSLSLNLHVATGKSIALMHRVLCEGIENLEDYPTVNSTLHSLSSGEMRKHLISLLSKRIKQFLHRRKNKPNWQLLYQSTDSSAFDFDIKHFNLLSSPNQSLNADPFIFTFQGQTFVFFEEIPAGSSKGRISVTEWKEDDTFSEPVCVLEAPFHCSFPFVFEHENQVYLIPETQENQTISLYEAEEFPYKWRLKKYLMENVEAGDNVVFRHKGKWWLFTSIKDSIRPDFPTNHSIIDELSIFYTDDILNGEWKPHAKNPVLSDITQSLNAGGIFTEAGRLYRVAQCGSPRYGYGIQFFEIVQLDENAFSQTLLRTLYPPFPLSGVHTFCKEGNKIMMDGLV